MSEATGHDIGEAAAPPRRRRRGARWLAILLAAAVVLWLGYWLGTRYLAATAIERSLASLSAKGRDIACVNHASSGFPFSLDIACGEASFSDRSSGASLAVSRIAASAPLYAPGRVGAVIEGPLVVNAPGGAALKAAWQDAAIDVDAGFRGLNSASVHLDQVEITPAANSIALGFDGATAGTIATTVRPGEGDSYRFAFDASDVTLRVPDRDLPAFTVNAALTAQDFGRSLGRDPARAVRSWLAAGGEVAIDRLLIATGEASAQAAGSVRFSPQGLLSGELTVRVTGLDRLPALAEQLRPGSQDQVNRIVRMAGALMRAAPDDANAREIPVTIRDGVARIGLIPLGAIPAFRF